MPNGSGQAHYNNGDIYQGDFINGQREGFGSYSFNKIYRYEGDWKNNTFSGKGKLFRNGELFFEG